MKLYIILVVIGFVGIAAAADPDPSSTTLEATDAPTTTQAPADGGDTTTVGGGDVTGASTGSPGPTQSPGPTPEPNTGATNPNPDSSTTLASTIPPTTTPPLKRDVSFNIDCTAGTQCSFQFKIAEPLMRFVNPAALESVLSNLTSKINDLNQASTALSTEESGYITTLQAEIDKLNGDVTSLNENLNGTLSDAQMLQETIFNASVTAQNYLAAAICFRNDLKPSAECGAIASGQS